MHVPDGFLSTPTSLATGGVAVIGIVACLRGARRELDDRNAPIAVAVSAFIFAAQMINFPVAAGTSGHLMGGALAAALVGPYTGVLCVSMVLLVQTLVFADGGLSALGTNIVLIALVTTIVAYGTSRLLLRILPATRLSVLIAVFAGALLSVPAAAIAFAGLYTLGGATSIPVGSLTSAMVGVHLLIGVGEAIITTSVVAAILATRSDLVHLARFGEQPASATAAAPVEVS
ncbi:MAG: energy-coupling factor ABC transporter permease [Propioniciclava sp.]